jgi:hypothetical protein
VVAVRDAVLVAGRGRGQDVKKIVDRLAADGRREHVEAARLDRAGACEELLARAGDAEVRLLTLAPGGTLAVRQMRVTLLAGAAEADAAGLEMGAQLDLDAATLRCVGAEPAVLLALRFS